MKSRPTILLAVTLTGLCAICLFQWKREADFRTAIIDLSGKLDTATTARTESEARIAILHAEIQRLETIRADTESKYLATLDELIPLQSDWIQRGLTIGVLSELASATAGATAGQNAAIEKQNEMLKRLAAERDGIVEKLNARTREFNDLTTKYNQLVRSR